MGHEKHLSPAPTILEHSKRLQPMDCGLPSRLRPCVRMFNKVLPVGLHRRSFSVEYEQHASVRVLARLNQQQLFLGCQRDSLSRRGSALSAPHWSLREKRSKDSLRELA